jgi:hypothetical protein
VDGEALQRQSEGRLAGWGLKVNPHLPPPGARTARPAAEVAARGAVLAALAEVGEGAPPGFVLRWTSLQGLDGALTAGERALLSAPGLAPVERDGLRWGAEAAWALAWALGRAPVLDAEAWAGTPGPPWPSPRSPGRALEALAGAALRPLEELLREADLAFRLHWAVVDAAVLGEPFPAERFHPDRVVERRRALEWVLSPGVAWDAVDLGV